MKNSLKTLILQILLLKTLNQTHVIEITDKDYPKVLQMTKNSKVKAVIIFYSQTCPHCKTFLPDLDKLSDEFYNQSKLMAFFKIDVFKYRQILNKIEIGSMPDVKVFGNGVFIENAKNGYSSAMPLFRNWLDNLNLGNKGIRGLARVRNYDLERNEEEFKMKLGKGYLGKIESEVGFAKVLFKEVYDSRQHNWFKDDEDLVEAFF